LFSSSEVAGYINATFEPVWESVRPAPLVTIDFGNGHVVKRTLQGNVATYVCGADGTVYDVLPGIYTPDVYRKQLEALKVLADSLSRFAPPATATPDEQLRAQKTITNRLREYHTRSEFGLSAPPRAQPTATQFQGPASKSSGSTGGTGGQPTRTQQMQAIALTGGGIKGGGFVTSGFGVGANPGAFGGNPGVVWPGNFGGNPGGFGGQPALSQVQMVAGTGGSFKGGGFPAPGGGNFGSGFSGGSGSAPGMIFSGIEGPVARVIAGAPAPSITVAVPKVPLAERSELKLDADVNERIRRKAVHAHLVKVGTVRPDDIKKWLFREVLHADLDDPKLGLGPLLNENYPFAEEDAALSK
jgi:hypothetical protein